MTDAIEIIFELQRRYAFDWEAQAPVQVDIARWAGGSDEAEATLYDAIAAELARGYHVKRYSFEFCDAVVNQLYALMIAKQLREPPPAWPKLFSRVYEAFDAGEWANPQLPPYDPIKTYTDPEIAEIVREL